MSMRPEPIAPVPEDTARVAKAAFPKGSTYIEMRNVLGTIYDDEDFSESSSRCADALPSRRGDWL